MRGRDPEAGSALILSQKFQVVKSTPGRREIPEQVRESRIRNAGPRSRQNEPPNERQSGREKCRLQEGRQDPGETEAGREKRGNSCRRG